MKISSLALTVLVTSGGTTAFVSQKSLSAFYVASPRAAPLFSLAPPVPSEQNKGGRAETEIKYELISGKVLEGGKVIDFEAIKGPSKAEHALLEAKNEILSCGEKYVPADKGILGINADVIAEVGHDLGVFASDASIQKCASYLRSKASEGFFKTRDLNGDTGKTTASDTLVEGESSEIEELLRKAYFESGEVTGAFAKTFFMGTQLLPEAPREAIWAIYVWCRRTDEIVDAPRDSDEEMLKDLASWEMRLENLWKYGEVEDVFDLCLLDVLVKYPTLPITPFMDMIRGMLMDVPSLGQDRYDTFDELHLYCYRVAGTVGLMSLPVFGCAEGYDDVIAK
jgi:15-cis-phytoene synthase